MFNKFKETAEDNYINNIINSLKQLNLNVDKFLDLGCYDGIITQKISLAVNSKETHGFDQDYSKMAEASKKRIKTKFLDLEDNNWNVEREYFDFVFNNQVIEHLYDIDNFLINIKKLLKKMDIV